MIIYVIMYGDGKQWLEPIDLDNPPDWFDVTCYTIRKGIDDE